MALNIPMPQNGMDSFIKGFGVTDNLMRQLLERRQLKQREDQFKEELALKKQAQARAGANSDLTRAIMQEQLLGLKHKNDPNYEFNQFKALQDMITGNGVPGGNASGNIIPAPQQEMGEGLGMFSPEGLVDAQQPTQMTLPVQAQGSMNFDAMRQNPMLRGFFKHKFGFDPLGGETNVLHGPARDASDLAKLKKEAGENSDVYQNAKAAYDANIEAKKDLRDLRARTKAGLKPGEKEFFDEQSGAPLGKEIPLTAKEREAEEGNILFNELYPFVYKGASPFSGEGSISRLQQAAAHYKTDPQARKLFDDFLLAEKMLAATTVNEASTLKAGRTNRTYNMLKESLEAQDIPRLIKKAIKEYGVPASAQLKAAMRYQKYLSQARNKARKGTPATQKLYYNPELQAQHEQQISEGESVTGDKEVVVIDPSGKRFNTTEANAAHLPKGWSRG